MGGGRLIGVGSLRELDCKNREKKPFAADAKNFFSNFLQKHFAGRGSIEKAIPAIWRS